MTATVLAAWIGACSGVGSLLWNVYTKLTSGPKLRVTAFAGMVMMPPPPNNPNFLKMTVQNVGTAPTTLTNLSLHTYGSRWAKFKNRATVNAVLNHYQGAQLPHKLEVGAEWSGLMEHDEKFNGWLGSETLWFAVHHSFSKKPTQVRIFNPVLSAPKHR
jgi:hypothetical protein